MDQHANNIADELFEKSRLVIRAWPKGLAEIFELLVWTMNDNGTEISRAIERWLLSDDVERVRVAVEVRDWFPFPHATEMDAALAVVKARWPELASLCDEMSAARAAGANESRSVPADVQARVDRLRERIREVRK